MTEAKTPTKEEVIAQRQDIVPKWVATTGCPAMIRVHMAGLLEDYTQLAMIIDEDWVDARVRDLRDPTKSVSEKFACTALKQIPIPDGFNLRYYRILSMDKNIERSHYFLYSKDLDLIICISPGQFVDDFDHGRVFNTPGQRIAYFEEVAQAQESSIVFSDYGDGVDRVTVMIGSPDEIRSVLGLDYFHQELHEE